ncbi:MAG: hypothetical protein J6A76_00065 [Oscillospiraceae bacterium]|nr:hypothetical protein [Oscillospiraceae bacterium]
MMWTIAIRGGILNKISAFHRLSGGAPYKFQHPLNRSREAGKACFSCYGKGLKSVLPRIFAGRTLIFLQFLMEKGGSAFET